MRNMGKYDPLKRFLVTNETEEVAVSFDEIEALLGAPLPASRQYPAWWSNNPSNNPMTKVWLEAGYRTERLDLAGRKVVFRRVSPGDRSRQSGSGGVIERLQAALRGTARVAPGVDLTEPTGEVWDAERR
jgi:hypothetical protein